MGSCFAEHIARLLADRKFPVFQNPFGIIYNPVSLAAVIDPMHRPDERLFVCRDSAYFSFQYHSKIWADSGEKLLETANALAAESSGALLHADALILTLGSAWVYEHVALQTVVANCHKLPQHTFRKRLLSISECVQRLKTSIEAVRNLNSRLRVLITVSPVRHLKDTFEGNSLSKSTLLLCAHEIVQELPYVSYFPAYELLLDDLRDYRFYASDMLHPSEQAIGYILDKFCDCYLKPETIALMKQYIALKQALQHQPFRIQSAEYQNFMTHTLQKLYTLREHIPVDAEIELIHSKLL